MSEGEAFPSLGLAAAAGGICELRRRGGVYGVETARDRFAAIRTEAGAPLGERGTLEEGWQPRFVHAGFAPVYLLEWRDGRGDSRAWYLDSSLRACGGGGEPPPAIAAVVRQKAGLMLLGLWNDLLCRARPACDPRAGGLRHLGRGTIAQLIELCAPILPARLAAIDVGAMRGDREVPLYAGSRFVTVRTRHLRDILDEPVPFMERAAAGFAAGKLSWPSPVDGSPLATDAVLLMQILHCAYRLFDAANGLLFYVYAGGEEGRVGGVLFPAARQVFARRDGNPLWPALPQLGQMLLQHLCRYAEPLAGYLAAEERTLGVVVHGHHHGHVLFEDLAGLDALRQRLPAGRLPDIDMRRPGGESEAGEVYGRIEALFPEYAGKVRRHADFWALIGDAYAHRRALLRLAPQYLTRRLAERVVEVNLRAPELAAEPAHLDAIRRQGWPLLLLDLRVENRTLVDLAGFCARLLAYLLGASEGLGVALCGHTGSYKSPIDVRSKRSPVAAQQEIAARLREEFAGRPVAFIDNIGMGMPRTIFWSRHADFFVVPWGASLVIYRWLCNKPGLILTNRWGLTQHARGPGVDFFCSPRYMEAPGPVWYIAPEHVEDRPDAPLEFWTADPPPSVYNFRVDEAAVFAQVGRLMREFGPQAAGAAP